MPFRPARGDTPLMRTAGAIGALTVGLITGTAATTDATVRGAQPAPLTLPAPTGHDRVGTVSLHLVDPTRRDPWVPSHPPRELMISVWYPAVDTTGYPTAPWLEPAAAAQFLVDQHLPAGAVTVPTTAGHVGAPVDRGPHPRPVVLYSPGLQADRSASTTLVEQLASEGYVVVTIDHTHDAAEVEFPGGRVELSALPSDSNAVATEAVAVRAADTRFVLDQLTAMDHGTNPDVDHARLPRGIAGALDLSRIGMFGWSDGGATVAAAMRDDRRIIAGVSMDGSFYGSVPADGLDRPFLLLSSQNHNRDNDPSWASFWAHLRGWKLDLKLLGTQHQSFSDTEVLLPQIADLLDIPPGQVTQTVGTLNPDRAVTIERRYLSAFFDLHLRHRESRLLTEPSPRFPEVQFIR
jgi:predicted dienelactone hydrolase